MALQAKEIKNRLRSIKNSKKITKAMELVSAAKMRRAVQAALNTRTYANMLWDIMNRVVSSTEIKANDPLRRFFMGTPDESIKRITLVIFTSNRGLCGAFNSNVTKRALKFIQEHGEENVEVIAVGKRGVSSLNSFGIKAELAYAKDDVAKSPVSIEEISAYVFKQYKERKTSRVIVMYTDYRSAVLQVPATKQLFPLLQVDSISEAVENETYLPQTATPKTGSDIDYIYEPGKYAVLEFVIPRLAEVQLYQALLESNASEHSARMLAMKSATDAAKDMIDDLTLALNRARQASITKEIAEISAGAAAVS